MKVQGQRVPRRQKGVEGKGESAVFGLEVQGGEITGSQE